MKHRLLIVLFVLVLVVSGGCTASEVGGTKQVLDVTAVGPDEFTPYPEKIGAGRDPDESPQGERVCAKGIPSLLGISNLIYMSGTLRMGGYPQYWPPGAYIKVVDVLDLSPAKRAGLQKDDLIVGVNEKSLPDDFHLMSYYFDDNFGVGDTVVLEIFRVDWPEDGPITEETVPPGYTIQIPVTLGTWK